MVTKVELIQKAVDYIEENLKSEITLEDLMGEAYFSKSHYLHIFQLLVGMPCKKYINRRRLLWSLYEMKSGKKGIEAALDYGYETYAGFYKAFRREFACTPSAYLKRYAIGKPHRLNLGQEEYLMVSEQKLKTILSFWNGKMQDIVPIRFANGEISDDMWSVTRQGEERQVVLCACTSESSLKHCIELAALEVKEGMSAATPMKTKDGKDYVTDGDLCFYLIERQNTIGEMKNPVDFYCVPEQAKAVGRILARLHQAFEKYAPGEFYEERDIFDKVVNLIPKVRDKVSLPEDFYQNYIETTKELGGKMSKQLIHRDPHYGNIILEAGKCAGFLHFELASINYRIFDLCYAATAVLSEIYMHEEEAINPAEGIWFPIYHNIVKGYETESSLSETERRAMPYMVFYIQMMCVAYFGRYDKFERLARANEKMLLWLWENRKELELL